MPNTGPKDGSLKASTAFFPILCNPSAKPIAMVVFPSPSGVGLIAVTKISFPFLFCCICEEYEIGIFALYFPYVSNSSSGTPSFCAICVIGCKVAFLAISISCIQVPPLLFTIIYSTAIMQK